MFLQTLVVGLLQPNTNNLNIRFYWLEFIISCVPYLFGNSFPQILTTIVKCICNITQAATSNATSSSSPVSASSFYLSRNIYNSLAAKDLLILLKALQTFLAYSTTPTQAPPPTESKGYSILHCRAE
jgi:hypothetical protein